MKKITLTTGYGVYKDSDGKISGRFDLPIGEHYFPDDVSIEEYETLEDVMSLDYPPSLTITTGSTRIVNDGVDTVTVSIDANAESEGTWDGYVSIDGEKFSRQFDTGTTVTEEITTTKQSGTVISVQATGDNIVSSDVLEIEVIE